MPRIPRLDAPGSIHHVMNRGARRTPILGDDDSHLTFLDLLSQLPERHGVKVHAYALMPNHFHLLLTAGPRGLGPALQLLQGGYSRWLNRSRSWDGPVWKARFRSRRVEDETYLQHLLAYIHLNPVAAHLAPSCDRAEWTSHAFYTGQSPAPDWLSTTRLADAFGTPEAYSQYVDDVQRGRQPGPSGFDPARLWVPARRTLPPPTAVAAPTGPLDVDAAMERLVSLTDTPREALVQRSRGRGRRWQWWLTLWWLPRATGQSAAALARMLETHPAAMSRAAQRLRDLAADDPVLAGHLHTLQAELRGS